MREKAKSDCPLVGSVQLFEDDSADETENKFSDCTDDVQEDSLPPLIDESAMSKCSTNVPPKLQHSLLCSTFREPMTSRHRVQMHRFKEYIDKEMLEVIN
jgi:hypothetical protein